MPEILGCKAQTELRWWHDFWRFQPVVVRAAARCPLVMLYLLFSVGVSAFFPALDRLMGIADGVALTALSCTVVYEVWAEISGEPRQDHRQDYERLVSAWGNGIMFSLGCAAGLLLFIAPGVIALIACSLGIAFVCLERMRAAPAWEASRKLVKGKYWYSFRYLMPTATICLVVLIGSFIGIDYAMNLVDEKFSDSLASNLMTSGYTFATWWLIVSLIPLQVRLYQWLKGVKGEPVAVANVHAADR
jgi:hypothetical protein